MSDLFSYNNTNADQAPAPLGKVTLFGEMLRHLFVSDDSSYCVAKMFAEDHGEVTITGELLSSATPGQELEVTGQWIKHKTYGRQLKVENFQVKLPSSNQGMIRYLSENLPGIGKKTAETIVDHFGPKTFDILDNYTSKLKEVPGIGKKRIEEIQACWQHESENRDTMVYLQGIGLSPRQCKLVQEKYGDRAVSAIQENPYLLAQKIRGIGFIQADKIAQGIGIENNNPFRLASALVHTLKLQASDGHTCLPLEYLMGRAQELLKLDQDTLNIGLQRAQADGSIELQKHGNIDYAYDPQILKDENLLLKYLKSYIKLDKNQPHAPSKFSFINQELNQEQRTAVEQAFNKRLSIITGGPGVGKTTTVKEIVAQAKSFNKKIRLAAPTGRAAQRLGEASKMKAFTIHRMLMSDGDKQGEFVYNEYKKLKCDILVVDEISMLDIHLAAKLFAAIEAQDTHIVLVGDPDQLPSVGPGLVLNDLINSQLIPIVRLKQIFRQAASSRIISNAHKINANQNPNLQAAQKGELEDFYFINQEDPEKICEIIAKMIKERIPEKFGISQKDCQVLVPMNRGKLGTDALNEYLQNSLNDIHKTQFKFGNKLFVLGDRVIQTVNNYQKKIFNGDLGYITDIDMKDKRFTISFDHEDVIFDFEEAEQIRLAYAITIHKSQGSEFPAVIIPMTNAHFIMLKKNLLYTGITRAKELMVLCSSRKVISTCLANRGRTHRFTLLQQKLSDC